MWENYYPIYKKIEKEFSEITFSIALDDIHLNVYSNYLSDLLLRCSSECENIGKSLIKFNGFLDSKRKIENLTFPEIGNILSHNLNLQNAELEITWIYQCLSIKNLKPFESWNNIKSSNPFWFKAYNNLKHDRINNIKDGNVKNVIYSMGALFILNLFLRKDNIESETEWIGFARKRITSYSDFFSPRNFLQLGSNNNKQFLKLLVK